MLQIVVDRTSGQINSARVATDKEVKFWCAGRFGEVIENRNDWPTINHAKAVADALGADYIATDAGPYVSPRYDVIKLPKVGDEVSYTFNGDHYPCGTVASISTSMRIVTTTEGQKFYRVRDTGCWKYNKTWSLEMGHVSKLNPEF